MKKKKNIGIREKEFAAEIMQILDLYYCQDLTFEETAEMVYGDKKNWCKVRRRKEKFINKLIEKLKKIWKQTEPNFCITEAIIKERRAIINQYPKELFADLLTQALEKVENEN